MHRADCLAPDDKYLLWLDATLSTRDFLAAEPNRLRFPVQMRLDAHRESVKQSLRELYCYTGDISNTNDCRIIVEILYFVIHMCCLLGIN